MPAKFYTPDEIQASKDRAVIIAATHVEAVYSELDKGFGKALKQVYDGPVDAESIAQFAKDEYGFEPTGQVEEITQPEPEPVVQDDARARVAALDANSKSDVPADLNEQLAAVIKNGSVKDSLRAKLNLIEQDKNK